VTLYHFSANSPIFLRKSEEILWIKPAKERSRSDQVTEHHGELAPFGTGFGFTASPIRPCWTAATAAKGKRFGIVKPTLRAKHFESPQVAEMQNRRWR
jgi:hypothetical protein